jgi:hypothetical protein
MCRPRSSTTPSARAHGSRADEHPRRDTRRRDQRVRRTVGPLNGQSGDHYLRNSIVRRRGTHGGRVLGKTDDRRAGHGVRLERESRRAPRTSRARSTRPSASTTRKCSTDDLLGSRVRVRPVRERGRLRPDRRVSGKRSAEAALSVVSARLGRDARELGR